MKKHFKTLVALMTFLIISVQLYIVPAYADSATISVPSSVYMGEEFNVTVTFSSNEGVGAVDATLHYNADIIQCVSNPAGTFSTSAGEYTISFYDANGPQSTSFTFKFKGIKNATAGISVDAEITDRNLVDTEKKQSSTSVKVIDKSTLSGNANLKSLILSNGTLSPAFSPNVTNYNITVDHSVTQVLVSATTQEAAATISVQGSSKMSVGDNKRTVVVTAPNGTKKNYVLNIKRLASGETDTSTPNDPQEPTTPELNPYEVAVGGQKKYLANDYSLVAIPEGFTVSTAFINGTDLPALTNALGDKVLVYATDETGENGRFYLFNAEEITFTLYMNYVTKGASYIFIDYASSTAIPAGYYYCPVQIGDYSFNGFKYEDAEYGDFSIVYAETVGGTKAFYRYDKSDGSLQRAVEFTLALENAGDITTAADTNLFERFMAMDIKGKAVIIALFLVLVLIIVLIIITIVKKSRGKKPTVAANEELAQNDTENGQSLFYTGGYEDFDDDEETPIIIDSAYHLNSDDEDKE